MSNFMVRNDAALQAVFLAIGGVFVIAAVWLVISLLGALYVVFGGMMRAQADAADSLHDLSLRLAHGSGPNSGGSV